MRGFVTVPLERAIAASDGIDYIQSQSSLGLSRAITVRLKLNYDPNKALAEISSRVNQVPGNDLPPEAEVASPSTSRRRIRNTRAVHLSFTSDILKAEPGHRLPGAREIATRLSALEGVQRADILGGRTFAMRIWLKPDRLAAYNINPDQIRQSLAANNFLSAVGHLKGLVDPDQSFGEHRPCRSVKEFQDLVLRRSGDQLVRLSDVADVELGAEDYDTEVRFSGEHAVFMGVWVLPNANSLEVITRVRTEMDSIVKELPTGLSGRIAYDATSYINDAIHEVLRTLLETLIIVSIVIFLFLGSLRSVLVPPGGDPDFADRRHLPDAGLGLHHQPADLAGDCFVRRPGGG